MDDLRDVLGEMEQEEREVLKQRAEQVGGFREQREANHCCRHLVLPSIYHRRGLFTTRSLSGQIGQAVRHVESSSTELQSAANQQASGAKESSTAMNEITTTISELLATSRQIAESAQRVAHVAEETSAAARAGDETFRRPTSR